MASTADAAAEKQLGEDQARFDALAEADRIREQHRDSRHLQRTDERHELEAIDLNSSVEWGRDRLVCGFVVTCS